MTTRQLDPSDRRPHRWFAMAAIIRWLVVIGAILGSGLDPWSAAMAKSPSQARRDLAPPLPKPPPAALDRGAALAVPSTPIPLLEVEATRFPSPAPSTPAAMMAGPVSLPPAASVEPPDASILRPEVPEHPLTGAEVADAGRSEVIVRAPQREDSSPVSRHPPAEPGPGEAAPQRVEPASHAEVLAIVQVDEPGLALAALAAGDPPSELTANGRARQLLALGLGVEASSVLGQPSVGGDPSAIRTRDALAAAARYLAGRGGEGLFAAALDGDPEIGLWRHAASVVRDSASGADEADVAQAIELLLAYPPRLRCRLAPDVVTAIGSRGDAAAAGQLLARLRAADPACADQPALALAAAEQAAVARSPRGDAALAALGRSTEWETAVAAREAATRIGLATGRLDQTTAIAQLEAQQLLWRGHRNEIRYLNQLAELQVGAGRAAAALATFGLIEQRAPTPGARQAALGRMRDLVVGAVASDDQGAGLRILALARRHPPILAGDDAADLRAAVERRLAPLGLADLTKPAGAERTGALPIAAAPSGPVPSRSAVPMPSSRPAVAASTARPMAGDRDAPRVPIGGSLTEIKAAVDREIATSRAVLASGRLDRR